MAFFGNFNQIKSSIRFIKKLTKENSAFGFASTYNNNNNKMKSQSLSLLNQSSGQYVFDIFSYIPRHFTISTNHGSCKFNIEMLKDASPIILKHIQNNPNDLNFHIDISDEENVLSKFELLFQGKVVTFDEDELPTSQKITKALNLRNCPNFMKPESLKSHSDPIPYGYKANDLSVEIDKSGFQQFLQNEELQTFVIKTNKRKYKCNKFGVHASFVISKLNEENQEMSEFEFDFDDEFDEFQMICDLFNFEAIKITKNNMDCIKLIADELQINDVLGIVNKYIEDTESVSKTIDDQQTNISKIDDLFDLLYNINEKTVETVKDEIIESEWSNSTEKVQELAAFILQIISNDFLLQQPIFELLIQLNEEANQSNKLDVLLPFIVKQLMFPATFQPTPFIMPGVTKLKRNEFNVSESRTMSKYAFIYKLYKKGLIPKEDLMNNLTNSNFHLNSPITVWFLPELFEKYPNLEDKIKMQPKASEISDNSNLDTLTIRSFIMQYLPDKIDAFVKLRDLGEPDDEITKALRIDDVDKFQAIVSKTQVDISNCFIPFNLFENFLSNGRMNYLNYAAAYGAIKCFKYLLLNHCKIDKLTFQYAVYGGNIEIIKIVDQQESNENNIDNENKTGAIHQGGFGQANNNNRFGAGGFGTQFGGSKIFSNQIVLTRDDERIIPSIIKHRNDLFDWIFEKKLANRNEKQYTLFPLLLSSVESGNAHTLIEIVENVYDIYKEQLQELIQIASINGFYMLVQILLNFANERYKFVDLFNNIQFAVIFGNLSIFKLFIKMMNQNILEKNLAAACEKGYTSIISYFFETLAGKEFQITQDSVYGALSRSVNRKDNVIFNYLIEKITFYDPKIFKNFNGIDILLDEAIENKNVEAAKILTNFILDDVDDDNKDDPNRDFTYHFIHSANDLKTMFLCKYFIDKKAKIDYEKISANVSELGAINEELFSLISSVSIDAKERILGCINTAIAKKNKSFVEYLLKNNAPCEDSLFRAVETNDIDIVNLILKYNNKPSFINMTSPKGTALNIAVSFKNLQIVKRLLELPGINPSLYCYKNETPLYKAIINHDLEITNVLIDFYKDDIESLKPQISKAIHYIINRHSILPNKIADKQISKNSVTLIRLLELKCININNRYNDFTLLTYACKYDDIDLVKYLLQSDEIDTNIYEPTIGNSPLMIAVENNNFEITKLLIEHPKTDINAMNYYQRTALIIAVVNHFDSIIELLINDEKFDPAESKLDFAFFISSGETSKKLLTNKSLDVNYKSIRNVEKQKRRHPPFENAEPKQPQRIRHENYIRIKKYGTALTNAVEANNMEMIDLITQHPTFNINKSLIKVAIAKAAFTNNVEIMRKLLKLVDNQIFITDTDGNNLLNYAIMNMSKEAVVEILNNENFDSKKFNLVQVLVFCYTIRNNDSNRIIDENTFSIVNRNDTRTDEEEDIDEDDNIGRDEVSPIDIMNTLCDFDEEHDHLIDFSKLLPDGRSFFSTIYFNSRFTGSIVRFLLQKGVNPNQQDSFGIYPLENAIIIHCTDFVVELMNSNEIDYSQKLKSIRNSESFTFPFRLNRYTGVKVSSRYLSQNKKENKNASYLHLAALSSPSILQEFVNRRVIDVNVTDEDGNTPLMLACKNWRRENIHMLAHVDNLDFRHRNKEGQNVLDIVSSHRYCRKNNTNNNNSNSNNNEVNDREDFLNRLMSYV